MATNFTSDLKRTAKKNIVRSFFGSGVVGRAVMRTLNKKQEEDPVSEALEEQNTVQDQINATIMRLESIVTNIADNVYNIAGVWSDQVVSMKEAKRAQEERLSKQQAELEEAQNESTKVLAPLPSATAVTKPEDTAQSGVVGGLMKSLTGTRNLLRGLMGKVGLIAAGLAVAGAATAAVGGTALANRAGDSSDESTPTSESQVGTSSPENPTDLSGLAPANNTAEATRRRVEQLKASTSSAQPQASLVSQPATASTSTTNTTNIVVKDKPVIAQVNGQPYQFSNEQEYKEFQADSSKFMLQQNNGMFVAVKNQSSAPTRVASGSATQTSSTSSPGGLSGVASALTSSLDNMGGLAQQGQSVAESFSNSLSNLTSNVLPNAGQELASLSTSLLEPFSKAIQQEPTIIQNNTAGVSDDSEPSPLPSPIADRGSLDIGTTFRARY